MQWYSENFTNKQNRLKQWHNWFAWHPVYLYKEETWVWLQTVRRRQKFWFSVAGMCGGWDTEYLLIGAHELSDW